MNYCPVCGNTEPDYKCKCIEEATGKSEPVKVEIEEYDRQAYIDKFVYG